VPPPTDATLPPYTPTRFITSLPPRTNTPTPTRFITSLPPQTLTPTPTRFITSLAVRTNTPTKPPTEILSLELQSAQPTLGQTVHFTGRGFTPNGAVTKTFIRPDGYTFGFQTQANAQGVVTGSLEITKDQPTGVWTVIATDEATKRQVRSTFNVSP
jgi:hypothetical protein